MGGILTRRWDLILPGCRWLNEPSNQQSANWVGFPHRRGGRPGGSPFSPRCRIFIWIEAFMMREKWDPISPGCHCLHKPQPIRYQTINGITFFTPCGAASTQGITVLVPGLLELFWYGIIYVWGLDPLLPGCVAGFSSPGQ